MSGFDQGRGSDLLDVHERARFEQLVLPHLDAAFNLARWLLRRREDSEDVTQEAMLRAYRFFRGFHGRSEEHTSELQSHSDLVCRLLLEKKKHAVAILSFSGGPRVASSTSCRADR